MSLLEPIYLEAPVETSAQEFRQGIVGVQEGVVGAGDLKVTAGAGMSVDVAAGVGLVQGDSVTDQGPYRVRNDGAVNSADAGAGRFELAGITAAHFTNPRIDQIVLRVYDATHDGSGQRKARFEVVAGTPIAAATLDNRNGAAALPPTALRLADVLIPAASSSISSGNIRGRRLWARGANVVKTLTTGNLVTTSASYVLLDAVFQARLECSGVPLLASFDAPFFTNASITAYTDLFVDGASVGRESHIGADSAGIDRHFARAVRITPAAGSHLIEWRWRVSAPTLTVYASTTRTLEASFQEIVRQNAENV